MGVTAFVVDMSVVRCDIATLVPDAFAGTHYLSMFGSVNYATVLPESMQNLVSRWLYRHGFPGSSDVLCACIERKIIELAYFSAEKLVLIEHWQHSASVLDVLDRLRCESWSLYNALIERMSLVVYGVDAWVVPSSPVPVIALSTWRRVHDVVASLDQAVNTDVFVPVAVPLIAEKAMKSSPMKMSLAPLWERYAKPPNTPLQTVPASQTCWSSSDHISPDRADVDRQEIQRC